MTFNKYIRSLIIILLGLVSLNGISQSTKIRGNVIDKETREPIAYASVIFKGTKIGTVTDFDGIYFIETRTPTDSLSVSYLGYKTINIKIKKNIFQTQDIELERQGISLQEVKILPGENPAHKILRNIIANKKLNSPTKLNSYQYEVYNKMEVDINNVDDDFKNKKVFKHFQFVFDYMDTSVVSGKSFLPVFISETLSDYYFNKNPKREKEVIKASKISGIENESISQFTGEMYQNVNIYKNYISVFGKSFISPIASFGLMYYKYYLVDSAFFDNKWCYQLTFKPKNIHEPTFSGDFWVNDTSFAIKKSKIRLTKEANLNFVTDMVDEQEFVFVDNFWMLKRDELLVDFNVADKTVGFFGRKTTSYRNIVINPEIIDTVYKGLGKEGIVTLEDSQEKTSEYWNNARHDSLSERELNIYHMIDTIQEVPIFKTYVEIIYTIFSGYWDIGKVQLGQYVKTFSYNQIEGNRFRFGGKTDTDFSEKIFLDGYLAYGTLDKRFKYHFGAKYIFDTKRYLWTSFSYKNDVEQLGQSPNSLSTDNFLGSVFKRDVDDKLNNVIEYNYKFESEWKFGLSNRIELIHRELYPLGDVNFMIYENTIPVAQNNITTFEIVLNTRFAYNEKFLEISKIRTSLGTKFPVLELNLIKGINNVLGSEYDYHKIYVSYKHHFKINPLGTSDYNIVAGKVFNKLPYPLLEIHAGNQTYWYDDMSFNLMNYYEFISDEFISFLYTHHFEGFFFNKVPLLKKLKWREVIAVKGVLGNMTEKNASYSILPDGAHTLNKPYYEGGVGIENIFTVFRVDALWRLSYLDKDKNPNVSPFGIRVKVNFNF